MMPTNTKAGGDSANNKTVSASHGERRAIVNAITPNASQYSATVNSNRLPVPGAIGSIHDHRTTITGDCQSPKMPLVMSL